MMYPLLWIPAGTLLVLLLVALILLRNQQGRRFRCRHCGEVFQPAPLRQLFAIHAAGEHCFTCPACRRRDFCAPVTEERG